MKEQTDKSDTLKLKFSVLWKTLLWKTKDKPQNGRKSFQIPYLIMDLLVKQRALKTQ
jgi:hypothetical protein